MRRTKLVHISEAVRDARLFIIATEGEKTEAVYFNALGNTRVIVQVVPCEEGRSAPAYLVDQVKAFARQIDANEGDQRWIVFDKDHRRAKELKDVFSQCSQSMINVALSIPSFELWLVLHHDEPEDLSFEGNASEQVKRLIARLKDIDPGWSKSSYNVDAFMPFLDQAAARAARIDEDVDNSMPDGPVTRVYRLINEIVASY